MMIVEDIKAALQDLSSPEKKEFFPRFFKTGEGEYGEGDLFLGVKVPDQRVVAKVFYKKISLKELKLLLSSKYHEERLTALLMLVLKFEKAKKDETVQQEVVDFYLNHLEFVNNWDLVDSTCYKILGRFVFENDQPELLRKLSKSDEMWHKRIAVVGTMHHIKKFQFDLTKEFVVRNLKDPHDLIQKANGWLLREMGDKDEQELLDFLNLYYKVMPRTCLRYAIEKLDENLRQDYLKGNI